MNEPKLLREIKPLTEDPVIEVEQILEAASGEDIITLTRFNLYRDPMPVKVKSTNDNILKYAINKVYTEAQLSKLALRYDMKLLPAKEYKGPVPATVAKAIRDWTKQKDKREGHYGARIFPNKVLIFAPRHMFHKNVIDLSDPIALYDLGDGNYEYITHWGNDFTWKRRVTSFIRLFNPFPVVEMGTFPIMCVLIVTGLLWCLLCVIGSAPHMEWLTPKHALYVAVIANWGFWIFFMYLERTDSFMEKM